MKPVIAVISQIKTTADHGIKIVFDCNEMSPEDLAALFDMRDKSGYLNFIEE